MLLPKRGSYLDPRHITQVYILGGTHGNERTGVHAIQYIQNNLPEFTTKNIQDIQCIHANYRAILRNSRYVEKDLNRCFTFPYPSEQKASQAYNSYEEKRAYEIRGELNALKRPVDFVIDLHTTTSAMQNCLIVSDDDPWTEYLCQRLRKIIPGCTILFEPLTREEENTSSSLGLNHITLEMGPVQQGVADIKNVNETLSHVKAIINTLEELNGLKDIDKRLESESLFKYVRTEFDIDYPRDARNIPLAMIHKDFFSQIYKPLKVGQPVFTNYQGEDLCLEPGPQFSAEFCNAITKEDIVPLFIGEAAYIEKNIAFTTARIFEAKN